MPLPPAGELRINDVTHSTMKLNWDAAPGPVTKYTVTYQPEDGEPKEVEHLDGPTSLSLGDAQGGPGWWSRAGSEEV